MVRQACKSSLLLLRASVWLLSIALFSAVSGMEDPEKMLEQTVNEMQADVIKMRQASAQVTLVSQGSAVCLLPASMCDVHVVTPIQFNLRVGWTGNLRGCGMQVLASQKQIEVKYETNLRTAVSPRCHSLD